MVNSKKEKLTEFFIAEIEESLRKSHFKFQRECLEEHNRLRREHGVHPFRWDTELAEEAQNWADHLSETGQMHYCAKGKGENIGFFPVLDPGAPVTSADIVSDWGYKERREYDPQNPQWQPGTNHFTQMVWRASKLLGIGRAYCESRNSVVIVAFYSPPGNINQPGEFQTNVSPILSKETID